VQEPARVSCVHEAGYLLQEDALCHVCTDDRLSMTALARELELSVSRVSRLIARAEAQARSRSCSRVRRLLIYHRSTRPQAGPSSIEKRPE
jgi:hypothetical protein